MPTAIRVTYLPDGVDIEWHAQCHRLTVHHEGNETFLVNKTDLGELFNVSFETYQSLQVYLGNKCVLSFMNLANKSKVNNK